MAATLRKGVLLALSMSCIAVAHEESTFFSIPQVEARSLISANGRGPFHLARSYDRYAIAIPSELRRTAKQHGTAVATNDGANDYWMIPVDIDGQVLKLILDTGSSDFWVFSTLQDAAQQQGHSVFDPKSSSHWRVMTNYTWDVEYGDDSYAYGIVGTDRVTIGGVVVDKQVIELAQNTSSEFNSGKGSGVLGMGPSIGNSVEPTEQNTFFDNVKSSLHEPLIAVALDHDGPGQYDFGYLNQSLYEGPITYAPVDFSEGFWGFNASGFAVNGQRVDVTIPAIMDTGTSLLVLVDDIVGPYYDQVPGSQNGTTGFVFPCDSILPDLSLYIGEREFVVPSKLMNFGLANSVNATVLGSSKAHTRVARQDSNSTTLCYGSLQSSKDTLADDGFNVVGDIFMQSHYVVFNQDGPKVGVATRKRRPADGCK